MTAVDIAIAALALLVALLLAALVMLGRGAYRISTENAELRRELEEGEKAAKGEYRRGWKALALWLRLWFRLDIADEDLGNTVLLKASIKERLHQDREKRSNRGNGSHV